MSDDPFEDADFLEFADRALNLVPKIQDATVNITIVPEGTGDVKLAVELGFSVMMDKPIILMVKPGRRIPDKLRRIADEIVEWVEPMEDSRNADSILQAMERIERVKARRERKGRDGK